MKNLVIITSFVALPLLSGVANAQCQHGNYALQDEHNEEGLLAKKLDEEALELLRKRLSAEEKAPEEETAPIAHL